MTVMLYDAQGDRLLVKVERDQGEIPPFTNSDGSEFDPSDRQPGVACQGCGCTDAQACVDTNHPDNRCWWVEPGWCSICQPQVADWWFGQLELAPMAKGAGL